MSARLPLSLSVHFVSDDELVQSYLSERLSDHPQVLHFGASHSRSLGDELFRDVDAVLWDLETAPRDKALPLCESLPVVFLKDVDSEPATWEKRRLNVVRRDAPTDAIVSALCAALQGFWVMDRAFLDADSRVEPGEFLLEVQEASALTAREREVLNLLAEGLNNREIADRLKVSVHTAKFHIAGILEKLDAASRTEAVVRAARLGLLLL